jgi:DNA-binding CsgD family transcriptional regulator
MNSLEIVKAVGQRSRGVFARMAKEIEPHDIAAQNLFIKYCAEQAHNFLAQELWGDELIEKIIEHNSWQPRDGLTATEVLVLVEICDDKTEKQIAETLKISVHTVRFHKTNLYKKINANGVAGLVRYAIREGYVSSLNSLN